MFFNSFQIEENASVLLLILNVGEAKETLSLRYISHPKIMKMLTMFA